MDLHEATNDAWRSCLLNETTSMLIVDREAQRIMKRRLASNQKRDWCVRGLRQRNWDGSRARSFPEERRCRKLGSSWGNPRCLDPADERRQGRSEDTVIMHIPREGGCTRQDVAAERGCTHQPPPPAWGQTRTARKARLPYNLRLTAWVPYLYACRSDAGTLGIGWTGVGQASSGR